MNAILERATAWLTPARRAQLYPLMVALGSLLVLGGVADDAWVSGWVGALNAVLAVLVLLLASWKAKRADWTAIYAAGAALVVALQVAGALTEGQTAHILDILAAGIALFPLIAATVRTSPLTPTGEPVSEYDARHGQD